MGEGGDPAPWPLRGAQGARAVLDHPDRGYDLSWVVWDAEKAALEVEDHRAATAWAAQTALREIIGQMDLADILVGRAKMDAELEHVIDDRTTP